MKHQIEKAQRFASLHVKGAPLVLYNCWDAGSAKVIVAAGARAVATGSQAVAHAHGFLDGEDLPLELALANAARIVTATDLPVSIDFEGGYATTLEALHKNIADLIHAGAIGCNFEDRIIGGSGLHDVDVQAKRIATIRSAADQIGVPFFINARTDIFLQTDLATHNKTLISDAVVRAQKYAAAGANGFFVPKLLDATLIADLVQCVEVPVNIMMMPGAPAIPVLASLGVARVSFGGGAYAHVQAALKDAALTFYGNQK
jgi:2-methylisocitrate lyase-like PEP mutase family enzyme